MALIQPRFRWIDLLQLLQRRFREVTLHPKAFAGGPDRAKFVLEVRHLSGKPMNTSVVFHKWTLAYVDIWAAGLAPMCTFDRDDARHPFLQFQSKIADAIIEHLKGRKFFLDVRV